jgi:hypothetical protein
VEFLHVSRSQVVVVLATFGMRPVDRRAAAPYL